MSEELQNTGVEMEVAAPLSEGVENSVEHDRQVPLSALESERAKRQKLEEDNRMMREHFELLRSQQERNMPKQEASPQDVMEDSDLMTYGEFKKLSSNMSNQFQASMAEMKMYQKHPDYQDVITTYLPEVLKNNPSLRSTLEKTQDYELAYYLAKNSPGYLSNMQTNKKSEEAQRIIKNSSQAGTLSSMGASTPVQQVKRYKDMSDAEFRELASRNRE